MSMPHLISKLATYFFLITLSFSFVFIHSIKYSLFDSNYYKIDPVREAVLTNLKGERRLILTSPRLFGAFVDVFDLNYHHNLQKAYMLFPFPDSGPTSKQLKDSIVFLTKRLPVILKKGAIWGSGKEFSEVDREKMTIRIKLINGSYITLLMDSIIYEDNKNIFFVHKNLF